MLAARGGTPPRGRALVSVRGRVCTPLASPVWSAGLACRHCPQKWFARNDFAMVIARACKHIPLRRMHRLCHVCAGLAKPRQIMPAPRACSHANMVFLGFVPVPRMALLQTGCIEIADKPVADGAVLALINCRFPPASSEACNGHQSRRTHRPPPLAAQADFLADRRAGRLPRWRSSPDRCGLPATSSARARRPHRQGQDRRHHHRGRRADRAAGEDPQVGRPSRASSCRSIRQAAPPPAAKRSSTRCAGWRPKSRSSRRSARLPPRPAT